VLSRPLIPLPRLPDILRDVDADLVVVAHCELARRETRQGRVLSVLESQLLVFGEEVFVPKEEPSAHAQRRLGLPLASGEPVVMERVSWVEIAP
jgi:hypothetical protein